MLEARSLAAIRGERLVFRDVSFSLASGGALLLIGPNGAGKSSLIRLLAGLTPPAAGDLLWQGDNALDDPPLHATRLCFVGHMDAIKPGLTVADNLGLARKRTRGDILAALATVDLDRFADLPARLLSSGQRRRLALSRLALSDAPLWLLDEPTTGLDAASVRRLERNFAGHRARGGMVIAATHLPLDLPGAVPFDLSRMAA
ncbi:MAG: heme ABC exporter ATP-binding protein CcmA [Acidiphilium sp. 37-64-53]|uniref:cytochrome c biogenesis heme-transporting ATPase CcmA n=1 Tax=Acidiphilium TaxID=522 RepID=UPI000BD9DE01|nr:MULTISPECIES: cytochrome c biogenesis heme-transporting ATPase CcmA [Acidiphilium]OYW02877.1 MAG: heme ABC exporter ATP-binding protein CcmA [Acidiphilium sp. 37-64-53]HQT84700.1 cytochrome c biogenesis heme-transporting ATPase CcmA [Acidiphilium rubrum]